MTAPTYSGRPRLMTDEQICAMYAENGDSLTVGILANCSSTTVLNIVRRNGGKIGKPGGARGTRILRHLTAEQMCQRYKAGESGPTLAKAAGCDVSVIYNTLEAHGIPRRMRARNRKP